MRREKEVVTALPSKYDAKWCSVSIPGIVGCRQLLSGSSSLGSDPPVLVLSPRHIATAASNVLRAKHALSARQNFSRDALSSTKAI